MARSAFEGPGTAQEEEEEQEPKPRGGGRGGGEGGKVPRSMVFSRGHIGRTLRRLEADVRKMMMPHTAVKLKALPFSPFPSSFPFSPLPAALNPEP